MLNKKLLAVALSMVVSGVAFGDAANDSHTLTVIVPEVTLLDVAQTASVESADNTTENVTFTCVLPTAAGDFNDTCASPNSTVGYSITANSGIEETAADIGVRKITVSLAAADTIDKTWKLSVLAAPGASGLADYSYAGVAPGTVEITTTTAATSQDVVTGIKNIVSDEGTLTYTLGRVNDNTAMAYTAATGKAITVTYTIGAEDV